MPLTDSDLERYARQVIIPGLGASGQARLLESSVAVLGTDTAATLCGEYLARSGVALGSAEESAPVTVIVAPGIDQLDDATLTAAAGLRNPHGSVPPLIWAAAAPRGYRHGYSSSFMGQRPTHAVVEKAAGHAGPIHTAHARIAACDAASTTLSLLLGWSFDNSEYGEVDLV